MVEAAVVGQQGRGFEVVESFEEDQSEAEEESV